MDKKNNIIKNIPYRILIILVMFYGLQSCGEKKEKKTETTSKLEAARDENKNDGFVQIFDGKSLDNWDGDPNYWRVENGNLVGEVTPKNLLKTNTFIIWKGGQPGDFELKLEFKIASSGNSGINYRSERLDSVPFALRGYQADIDGQNRYTGQNYEERKRTTLAYRGEKAVITSQDHPETEGSLRDNVAKNAWQNREVTASLGDSDSLKNKIKPEDWNKIHLVIRGNHLKHYVNGILMSEVIDNDTVNRRSSGFLGVQVHVGPPMKVEYRNIRLKKL